MKARELEEAAQQNQVTEQATPTCQGHNHNVHPTAGAGFSAADKKIQWKNYQGEKLLSVTNKKTL